jgi:hypothetical protein
MDLTLIDVACGYFGSFHYASSSALSFSFVRDIARLASMSVSRAKANGGIAWDDRSFSIDNDLAVAPANIGFNACQPSTRGKAGVGVQAALPSREDFPSRPQADASEWLDESFNWDSLLTFQNDCFVDA